MVVLDLPGVVGGSEYLDEQQCTSRGRYWGRPGGHRVKFRLEQSERRILSGVLVNE